MSFSYDRAWADVVAMVRANLGVLLAVAGTFIFLPDFARTLFVPGPELKQFDWTAVVALNAYFAANFVPIVFAALVMRFGEAAVLVLLLDPRRPTVSEALERAIRLLPAYFILNLLTTLLAFLGVVAFVVPGLYLIGRTAVASPALIAGPMANPLSAIERSLALTRGKGWLIAGLVFLVAIVTGIAAGAFGSAVVAVLGLALPDSVLPAGKAFTDGILSTVSSMMMLLLSAAIYRQLAPSNGS